MSSNGLSIHAVILSGGTGSRLWPFSRVSLPKNFIQVSAYAKNEQIIKGIKVDGKATAVVFRNA